jgi:hypothetical protein
MGAGDEHCPECEALLANYIAELRALGRHDEETEREVGRALQTGAQRALGNLLRHEYVHAAQRRRRETPAFAAR